MIIASTSHHSYGFVQEHACDLSRGVHDTSKNVPLSGSLREVLDSTVVDCTRRSTADLQGGPVPSAYATDRQQGLLDASEYAHTAAGARSAVDCDALRSARNGDRVGGSYEVHSLCIMHPW